MSERSRLDIGFDVNTDDEEVVDGISLAKAMIENGYRFLIPYVKGCPACADTLFSAFANQAIEEIHRENLEDGHLGGGVFFALGGKDGRAERFKSPNP